MTGAIVSARDLAGELSLDVDAVVVGTGAGGSIALRELARAGLNVVALEMGPWSTSKDFDQREDDMLPLLFQDMGGRATEDMAIRVLQGRGVGGSTVHNTNLCKRTPDAILDLWARKHGVSGASAAEMAPAFAAIEKDLSVTEITAPMRNANNEALRRGCEALGWKGGPLRHNRVGCQQSGFCELGCAYDAKQNALKIVVPQAVAAGARVYADVEVLKVLHDGVTVSGVTGVVRGRGQDGAPGP
ncbi:MAG: GMC family oxidoreductase N-terminal domain-containing protein, partial [Polyangiaceae bacterium]